MSELESLKMRDEYRKWILNRIRNVTKVFRNDENIILFDTDYAVGSVCFTLINDIEVAELQIVDRKTDENYFYLHFELKDLDHAKELFEEMLASFRELKRRKKVRILLCCSSGITTSYFKEKLLEAAGLLELPYVFKAVDYNRLYPDGFESDVILLAPQISYVYPKVKEILKDQIVLKIPAGIFASYDVPALIHVIVEALEGKENEKKKKMTLAERMEFQNTPQLLVIAVICEYRQQRIIYRIYDRGAIIGQNEVIKEKFYLRDIEDILDITLTQYPNIDLVCVCSPGVIWNGHITYRSAGIYDYDAEHTFTEKYGHRVIFINDANAMALGYYGTQKEYQNITFYFHPHLAPFAGVGNIIGGKLHEGRNSISGEMQYMKRADIFRKDPAELITTVEGSLEVLTKYLVTIISTIDPDVIAVYCDMVPDMEELRSRISEIVQEEFIPELVKIEYVPEYMFVGGLMKCVSILNGES